MSILNRLLKIAENSDERSLLKIDLLIKKISHYEPKNDGTTPTVWRKNFDYSSFDKSPYFGSVKDFLKKFPGGIKEYLEHRKKTKKERFKKWDTKNAALEELNRMPIMPIEMWTTEQLIYVDKHPELAKTQEEKEKVNKIKDEIKKRLQQAQRSPREIGKWREYGYWGIWVGGILIGFVDNEAKVGEIKRHIANDFSKGFNQLPDYLKAELGGAVKQQFYDYVYENNLRNISEYRSIKQTFESSLEKLYNDPIFAEKRKKFIESIISSEKAPESVVTKGAVITGNSPSDENMVEAERSLYNASELIIGGEFGEYDIPKDQKEYKEAYGFRETAYSKANNTLKNTKKFIDSALNEAIMKHVRGKDPTKECDDVLAILDIELNKKAEDVTKCIENKIENGQSAEDVVKDFINYYKILLKKRKSKKARKGK